MRKTMYFYYCSCALLGSLLVPSNAQHAGTFYGFQRYIVDEHNLYRTEKLPVTSANMQRLTWSEDLAQKAENWALACTFEHMTDGYGQNLYMDTNTGAEIDASIINQFMHGWGLRELNQYRSHLGHDQDGDIGRGIYNHYSQMVWSSTHQVGCAYAYCSGMRIVVCNYYPAGNYVGRGWYKAGPTCSQCPEDKPYCENGLCSSSGHSRAAAAAVDSVSAVLHSSKSHEHKTKPQVKRERHSHQKESVESSSEYWKPQRPESEVIPSPEPTIVVAPKMPSPCPSPTEYLDDGGSAEVLDEVANADEEYSTTNRNSVNAPGASTNGSTLVMASAVTGAAFLMAIIGGAIFLRKRRESPREPCTPRDSTRPSFIGHMNNSI